MNDVWMCIKTTVVVEPNWFKWILILSAIYVFGRHGSAKDLLPHKFQAQVRLAD